MKTPAERSLTSAPAEARLLLRVEGLAKGYGGPPVLRGVALDLSPGEALVLLGPNGAGKSTLLRVLAGLHKPQAGRILLLGEPFDPSDPGHRSCLGFVSHEILLYAGLSARENLRFVGTLFGLDRLSERITQVLEQVGLDWVGARPVRAYSRGMAQRLTLARALLHRPPLLLLDEPMTGLDPAGARAFEDLLVRFRGAGGGILMTTHDLAHAAPVATRAAFLRKGALLDGGPVTELSGRTLQERYLALFPSGRPGRSPTPVPGENQAGPAGEDGR